MPKPRRQLDSRIEIVTPENIAFRYVLAGPFRRLPAFLIDVSIRVVVLAMVLFSCSLFMAVGIGGLGIGIFLVAWFALSWFYGGFFETVWNGQTPGKRLLGLRVLNHDGQPINALQAVLRNVLRDIDAMPMAMIGESAIIPLYTLGLFVMASNDRYQRLGDLACGTIVVVESRSTWSGLTEMSRPEVVEFAQSLPVNLQVTKSMAQALSSYVARRGRFGGARRFEVASALAEPLCQRWGLPPNANGDLLLCALYYRTFIADRPGDRSARGRREPAGVAAQ